MVKCHICSKEVEPGKGMIFVTAKGTALRFCSRKCRISYKLGRSKKLGWKRKVEKSAEQKK